jgi:hypothetical protein
MEQLLRVWASVASEGAIGQAELVDDRHLPAVLIEVGHQLAVRAWRLARPSAPNVIVLYRCLVEVAVDGTMPVVLPLFGMPRTHTASPSTRGGGQISRPRRQSTGKSPTMDTAKARELSTLDATAVLMASRAALRRLPSSSRVDADCPGVDTSVDGMTIHWTAATATPTGTASGA